MERRRFAKGRIVIAAAAVFCLAAFLVRSWWLPGLAYALIRNDGPAKADIAVVLAGDYTGGRILRGAELVRQGYVPAVLVSGPGGFYGVYECDLAVAFAVRRGYPAGWFIRFPNNALSTRDEAKAIVPELRRRNVRSLLLVTSNYHTARAGRLFRWAEGPGGGLTIRTVAAPYRYFRPDAWWQTRQATKILFLEWCKTIATALGV